MFWVLENPGRLLRERSEIELLAGEVTWIRTVNWRLDQNMKVKVDVDMMVGDVTYDVELVYPNLFPDTPAYICPRASTTTTLWSSHQYGAGGPLCLEWGPDNWHSEVTGATLLRSTYKLLAAEAGASAAPTPVPSRHHITFGQEVRSNTRRMVVTDTLSKFLKNLPLQSHGSLVTHNILHQAADVFFVSEVTTLGSEPVLLIDLPSGVSAYVPIFALRGVGWLFKSSVFNGREEIPSLESLLAVIHGAGFTDFALPSRVGETSTRIEYLFLLLGPRNEARAYCVDVSNGGTTKEYVIVGMNQQDSQRLPPVHLLLSEKKVGVVGLGSIGSKVAVSLARSGVRKFLLVDDDIMLQENVCRHELDWVSVGVHKADAVKEAISLVAPGDDVQVRRLRVGGQESAESASTALDALSTCDLLLDATANPSVFLHLAAIAKRRNRLLVWGELFAGGIGGIFIRSRPGKDPEPLSMREGVHNFLATLEPAPFVITTTRYDVEGDDIPPLMAFDADVSQFSSTLTRFVLDTLLERNPSEFPYSAFLIGFKRAWIFNAPFDTYPISIEPPPSDRVNQPNESTVTTEDAIAFLANLMMQRADDHPRPAE